MTEQVMDKVEDLENKKLEEGEMPPALKAYLDKKGKKGDKSKGDDEEEADDEKEKMMKEKKAKMKEDIDAIFSGESLSEEFKQNAQAIFEAAIHSKVEEAVIEVSNLNAQINIFKKEHIVSEVSEGLSEVQFAKLKSLAEGIDFVSEQDYKEKLLLTKKKYFDGTTQETVKKSAPLDDDTSSIEESFTPVMNHYVQNISRTLKK